MSRKLEKQIAIFFCSFCLAIGIYYLFYGGSSEAIAPPEPVKQVVVQTANNPKFAIPIDCQLDKDCFILLYSDRDPGPGAIDFGCGRQTYDTHKGTDFAIPDERAMARGVAVTAAGPGKVLRVRDGVSDRRVRNQADRDAVKDTECGNGVVIDGGNGWETQYCHLRSGSLAVQAGDTVETGTILGMVGESGLASFPHVHISLSYQGRVVDPFVGPEAGPGCNVAPEPIWQQPLSYKPTGLIRAGFSAEVPDMDALWEGRFSETVLPANSPVLLFWVQAYGVLEGDKEYYRVFDPKGNAVIDTSKEIESDAKTWMGYAGKRNNPQRPLQPGTWRGEYRLVRDGKVLVDVKKEVELGGAYLN
jgi:murein DD-endopeptidase MepM/ murein hydrolase activator NlpD